MAEEFAWGFAWGFVSAVSAPIGAVIGLRFDIPLRTRCALMAFGAGALAFALSNVIFADSIASRDVEGDLGVIVMMLMALFGSVFFQWVNQMLNDHGAFERNWASLKAYLDRAHMALSPADVDAVLDHHHHHHHTHDHYVPIDGDSEDGDAERARKIVEEHAGDNPVLENLVHISRAHRDSIAESHAPSETAMQQPAQKNAGMAVYLGLLIDAQPESILIGIMTIGGTPSASFILGVFLSNFPEALSSARLMQEEGYSVKKILALWAFLAVYTGLGAGIAAALLPDNIDGDLLIAVRGIEGLAAGAMLALIAEGVLPEAMHGGGGVGVSTVAGFVAAATVEVFLGEPSSH